MKQLGRVLTAMVTPFKDNGEVDYDMARKLALALLDGGSDGLVVAATTGEAPTLSWEEELEMFRTVKAATAGRGSLVAYTGSNSTSEAVKATQDAEKIGVDACLSVVPYYNKPSQEGIYRHFKAIAEATSLPIIMYNIPGRVVVNMTPETIIRLSQIPNIIGVKEANGNMEHVAEVIQGVREGFLVWSGNDNDTFPIMCLGGYGVIGVVTHLVGKQVAKMIDLVVNGDVRAAAALHRAMVPLVKALFVEPNPAPVKYALRRVGLNVGAPRLPLVDVTDKLAAQLDNILEQYTFDIKP
jgi:4-hydroxy-tetrahydrodipicolinate synthase